MALNVAGMRGFVETTLGDTELGILVAAAYDAITERYGAAEVTERRRGTSGRVLMLAHRAAEIEEITEDGTELDEDDYALRPGGRLVERKDDGPHPCARWRGYVDIVYQNGIADAQRDRVAVALVQLDVNNQPGMTGERLGDHQVTFAANSVFNYEIEREAILSTLEREELVVF